LGYVERHYLWQGQNLNHTLPLTQEQRELRLRRMKRIPLYLLLLMVLLFALTLKSPVAWAGWVHAFAEAGMVGALADWFAVVALFRHPMGIPIPHTAIIPNRKNELGETMSRFVADHFLQPDVVRSRLRKVNLAAYTVSWLQSDKGRTSIVKLGTTILSWALGALSETRVKKFLSRLGKRQLKDVSLAPFLGHTVSWLVSDGRHQDVLTHVLRYAIVVLNDNRENIRERVQQESPWWIPGFVDDRILEQMLQRVETRLFEMTLDPQHPMRDQFGDWLERFADKLKTSPEHTKLGEEFKQKILENDALQTYLYGLWRELAGRLEKDLAYPDSTVRQKISDWLDGVTQELEQDEDIQSWINDWLCDAIVVIVERNRAQISSLISDTVKSWDGKETSKRLELAIGRDLQFIRINGTLVGGLVGLIIHAISAI
jgi:uncharacterized membrane-anchored protein YjiN (DUF445 family)